MIVGVPTEVKDNEYRVAATPEGVRELVHAGHCVVVQSGAGDGSALPDADFTSAGADVLPDADAVFAAADMILKVKEPQPQEFERFRAGQILFTYLHLAADEALTRFLAERTVAAVAYETVQLPDGRLPLLAPMSEIAGRMAPHCGASNLERPKGGRGVLIGGASGVAPAHVVVLGAGMAGTNAAWIAAGMEAEVTIVDKNVERLRFVDQIWRGRIQTVMSSRLAVERLVTSGGPGDRGRAGPGREGAATGDGGHGRAHAARRRRRGHLDRPGWLLRNLTHDDAFGPHVRGARRGPLLRGEHAGRGPAHLDVRAHQRDDPVRDRDREPRAGGGDPPRSRARVGVNVYGGHVTNQGVAEAHGMSLTPLDSLIDGLG